MARMIREKYRAGFAEILAACSPAIRLRFNSKLVLGRLVLGLVLPLVLIACSDEQEADKTPPADIAAGKVVAEANCVGCHGLDGKGTAPGIPNLAAQEDKYLLQSLAAYNEGKRMHAALRDLTTELSSADIRNVAGYYASLPPLKGTPSKEPKKVLSPYEKGKAAAAACASCHGKDGNSTIPGIPSLAGQQPHYFIAATRAYLYGTRSISEMEMLRELSHVDMESLALYYAHQKPALRKAPSFGDPAAGEPLTARCGGCHGAHGVSNDAATPNLAGQDAQYLVSAIKDYRDKLRPHNVMFDDNTDEEINNIAAFYSIQKSRAAERGPVTAQDLAARCNRCHGPDVKNLTMAVPKISGQDKDYLIKALRAYRDGKRGSSMMHNMSLPYSEAIIESIATYYAHQPAW